jgi:uncharacterized protein (TIGR02453 family)
MRIYRDIRFSPDKRPYKENLGMVFWLGNGKKVERLGFYFHLSPSEVFFYGGQHMFPKPVLKKYRTAIDDNNKGDLLESILNEPRMKPEWSFILAYEASDYPSARSDLWYIDAGCTMCLIRCKVNTVFCHRKLYQRVYTTG